METKINKQKGKMNVKNIKNTKKQEKNRKMKMNTKNTKMEVGRNLIGCFLVTVLAIFWKTKYNKNFKNLSYYFILDFYITLTN